MGLTPAFQLAIDDPSMNGIDELVSFAGTCVARIEAGTPLLTAFGSQIIERFARSVPVSKIYVDTKCIDFADEQLLPYLDLGVKHLSLHACITLAQAERALNLCETYGACCYVSTLGYPDAVLGERLQELHDCGATAFIFHGEGMSPRDAFEHAVSRFAAGRSLTDVYRVLAGGISLDTMSRVPLDELDAIIVGRAVTRSANPAAMLQALIDRMTRD